MHALLSVPITIRETVFGNLYLTHDRPSRTFTESDEAAAGALASAAAVAIDNARLFEHVRASAKWTRASREITTAVLTNTDPHGRPLQLIAERVCELTDAEQAIVLVPVDADLPANEVDRLVVSAAVGRHRTEVAGQLVPVNGSTTGAVFRSGAPIITESFSYPIQAFTDVGQRPAIVVPLGAEGEGMGVLAVARNTEQPPFDDSQLELVSDFANHAVIALMLAAGREQARELAILADRERIAHDLHDHVIQRLFAAGLDLQGTIARAHSPEMVSRLSGTLDDLQATIEDIRATIFKLQTAAGHGAGFRERIQDRIAELTENRDIATILDVSGPLTAVTGELADHAEAVVSEAVSNAVRHAQAGRLTVRIEVDHGLVIEVIDDGCGIPQDNRRRSGLANMERRAAQVGGQCSITTPPGGGTRIHWTALLS